MSRLKFFYLALLTGIIAFLSGCGKCKCPVKSEEITGDYIFLEKAILTSAEVIEGDSSKISIICVEPFIFYTFSDSTKELIYQTGPDGELPINKDLLLVYGRYNEYRPYAGTGAFIDLIPVYFVRPGYLDATLQLDGIRDDGTVELTINDESPSLCLPPDSSIQMLEERFGKVIQTDGDSALLRYTDKILIWNHGLAPIEKIKFESW